MNGKFRVASIDDFQEREFVKSSDQNCRTLGATLAMLAAASTFPFHLAADTFGTGANAFTMDFVTIGNPGNPADTIVDFKTMGSVGNVFRMGTYEVSEDMVTKANAQGNLGISFDSRGANKPATSVSWNEAARFVNWLNESSGYSAAYKFSKQPGENGYSANVNLTLWQAGDTGYNAANPYRNANAHYFLPSKDEWHKSAYYNPGTGAYFHYPSGSDIAPVAVAGGTASGTAVYGQPYVQGPADIMNAGGLSPYGTMAQGGNVSEWNETAIYDGYLENHNAGSDRGIRGGEWRNGNEYFMWSSLVYRGWHPDTESEDLGLRVAAVPEPEQYAAAFGVALLIGGIWLQRKKVQGVPAK